MQGLGDADWSELVTFAEQQGDVALRWDPSAGELTRRPSGQMVWRWDARARVGQSVPSTSAATRMAEPAAGTPA